MRQIATLPDPQLAQLFADYLLALRIDTQLMDEAGQVAVWVRDEDKVEQARQELNAFLLNPSDFRYGKAAAIGQTLRQDEARAQKEYSRRQETFEEKMRPDGAGEVKAVTFGLVIVSVVITLASSFGAADSPVTKAVSIASYRVEGRMVYWNNLRDVERGEVWRLVTPMFLHLDVAHLVFDVLALLALGTRVEASRGPVKTLAMVLLIAAVSNVAEFYVEWSLIGGPKLEWKANPQFGGMSGVVYGLFGYLWMKGRYAPQLGLAAPPEMVVVMIGWFVLCAVEVIPNVANVAHAAGLLAGVALGVAPLLWTKRPRPAEE
jgi:GlpG protein